MFQSYKKVYQLSERSYFKFGPKVHHIDQIGTKPGLFQIRFQYILAPCAIWCSPGFVSFGVNFTHLWPKSGHLWAWKTLDVRENVFLIKLISVLGRQRHYIRRSSGHGDRQMAVQECQICHLNWVRLPPNGTNLGIF